MKLSDARSAYCDYSGRLSDLVTQLDFAGVGIVWVLKIGDTNGVIQYGDRLIYALALLTVSLAFALFQYGYASIAWGIYHRIKEKQLTQESEEFGAPCQINWPTNILFWGKTISCIIAYMIIIVHIGKQLLQK